MGVTENQIPIAGIVVLPLEISDTTVNWCFLMADSLVTPLILGVDILKGGVVSLKKCCQDPRQNSTNLLSSTHSEAVDVAAAMTFVHLGR
jgi:hypothetical protein